MSKEKIIYKYLLEITDLQTIELPKSAKYLDIQFMGSQLFLWAMHDTNDKDKRIDEISIIGTGNPFPNRVIEHYKTVQHNGFVWHIFI